MEYEPLDPISREDCERALASRDPSVVCRALVSSALHDDDWRWVQEQSRRLARDPRPQVRGCAATSIGHLARLHGLLDLDVIVPLLQELLHDPEIGGLAEDALADIRMFVRTSTSAE